jgi:hypothetical protein
VCTYSDWLMGCTATSKVIGSDMRSQMHTTTHIHTIVSQVSLYVTGIRAGMYCSLAGLVQSSPGRDGTEFTWHMLVSCSWLVLKLKLPNINKSAY